MTDVAEFQSLTDSASELSDAITDLCRLWAVKHMEAGVKADTVMAMTGGAMVYSLAECCGQFVTPETRASWAATVGADIARMSAELAEMRGVPH